MASDTDHLTQTAGLSAAPPRVVGVGASAGGLQAFTELLQHLPVDTGLALVLVQHLDPQQPSLLSELLAAHTTMPVRAVVDQTPVLANQVYLIPPNTALSIAQGTLHLEPPTEAHGRRLPIDHFFRSLAADQGARAIGIVLSGTGTDGSSGLKAIKAAGGLTIAQRPGSAAFPAMPENAIDQGVVDLILDIAEMPAQLIRSSDTTVPSPPPSVVDTTRAIMGILQRITGHDFSRYKQSTLLRRIDRRIQLLHLANLAAYHRLIQQDRSEAELLFQDLLIGVTEFFRDPAAFETLATIVIPALLRAKGAGTPLRVWVPGCASGEEAYSIAILFHEQLAQQVSPHPTQLFATDIDEAALTVARRGFYDLSIAEHVPPDRLARYFVPEGHGYQISKVIRELCLFSTHNLISDPPFGRMDLISCRNLLIYFDADLQRRIIPILHYALAPGGYLVLGSAENAMSLPESSELFRVIDAQQRIYQRKERLSRPADRLPWSAVRSLPSSGSISSRPTVPSTVDIGAALQRVLLRDYGPTSAVIDQQGTIVYLTGRTSPYLMVPPGMPTTNVVAMAHPDLRQPLRTAIRALAQDNPPTVREDLTIHIADGLQRITLIVRPLIELGIDAGLFLVVLQDLGQPTPSVTTQKLIGEIDDPIASELQRTRDTLDATINELQETNSDLTTANEELRSLNEELQAANEELQTSKEEIQSINEELQTVNVELSRKIEDLDRANADLANLFASTQIPAIFLHTDGRIARFTPQATDLFALIDTDVGRPLSDLSARFNDIDLRVLIAIVLQTLNPIETVIRQPEQNRWWNLHIRPYQTLAGVIDGVVLTFADITTLKHAEAVLQHANDALDQRVKERTQDLESTNRALQMEVAERSRSEQARQRLIQQLVTAQEEERRHIARELHDQLSQDLTALILGLKSLQGAMPAEDIAERARQLQTVTIQISEEVRNLAVRLRPSALDDMGLPLALSNFIEQWSARAHVAADLHTSGLDDQRLPLAIESTLYRVVQEALTNVFKHANAGEVSVIIERHADEVRLIVEDDGVGFHLTEAPSEPQQTQQLGIIGMQERVALLGGTLTIESSPGSGTTIFARIPLPQIMPGGNDAHADDLARR